MQKQGKVNVLNISIMLGLVFGSSLVLAANPHCSYEPINIKTYGNKPFQNPQDIKSQNGSLDTTLSVQYTDSKTSIAGCRVKLRTYNGQLVGPTLRVKQGDVINLKLKNQLPKESPNEIQAQFEQENTNAYLDTKPASFNTTNVHYHGLHASPTGNSDNVLLAIPPQNEFLYEVKLPQNHPIGSYWYHAHAHGSTSIQVGSGMAGAIVIEDNPDTTPKALLAANVNEKILVLQTILYDHHGELNHITKLFPGPSSTADCNKDNKGTWPCSRRHITINGQIVPVITMKRGEVQRWRLIDSAFRESIAFMIEDHDLHEIALDGNYLGRVDTWKAGTPIDLQPGYRSDILVKASMKVGNYRVIDQATSAVKSLRNADEPENLLAILKVTDEVEDMALPTSGEMTSLAPFGNTDLRDTVLGVQEVIFKLGQDTQGTSKNYFQVNYQSFNPGHLRQLELNATHMWSLTTVGDPPGVPDPIGPLPHVFHIHVNPFQLVRKGPYGTDQLVWKDTLLVRGPTVTNIYTQYRDYIGKFVLHCHILDHEDLGMMEVEQVVSTVGTHAH